MLAGHTLVLQRLSGPGTVFVHAAGDFAGFTLGPGEVLRADTAALVWFDASVDYSAAGAGTVKRALLGGEGLFLSTFTGPGRVTLQTMGRPPAGVDRRASGEAAASSSTGRQRGGGPGGRRRLGHRPFQGLTGSVSTPRRPQRRDKQRIGEKFPRRVIAEIEEDDRLEVAQGFVLEHRVRPVVS